MKKIICLCNTYYQMILCIQMRLSLFSDCYMTIFMSDRSRNADRATDNLRKLGVFDEVILYKTREQIFRNSNAFQKVMESVDAAHGKLNEHIPAMKELKYDEFIYHNLDETTQALFSVLWYENHDIKCSRMEEGLSSYPANDENEIATRKRQVLAEKIRRFEKKRNLTDKLINYYCFYPKYYPGKLNVVRIPKIDTSNSRIGKILSNIFDLEKRDLKYPQKYIYFASIGDCESEKPVGEVEIATKAAELVGKENLIVKVHPRDMSNEFEKQGLLVDTNSEVPWEAIQLSQDFSNHVFLTTSSSSVISVNCLLNIHPKTYFLYKMCHIENNKSVEQGVQFFEDILFGENSEFKGFYRAENIDEILQ